MAHPLNPSFLGQIVMAHLQPAPRVILPRAEEGEDRLIKVGVEGIDVLHCDGVIEGDTAHVIVQVDAHSRRVPIVCQGQASILLVGIQAVLQAYAPVPHPLVSDVHLPVVLSTGELSCGQDAEEAGEFLGKVLIDHSDSCNFFCIYAGQEIVLLIKQELNQGAYYLLVLGSKPNVHSLPCHCVVLHS
ncbi:hypothetical protein JZ751_023025 [Albula glossodonta]|uniref:Uncharacterized protein n=1 Tax=Albula glossodonta TaxID=121402 RepID=A0A8T2PH01_9TELE|nr:hypothetical protein JZ751_023025 [Albula glossodonta]